MVSAEEKAHHPALVLMPLDRDFLALVLGLPGLSILQSLGSPAVDGL